MKSRLTVKCVGGGGSFSITKWGELVIQLMFAKGYRPPLGIQPVGCCTEVQGLIIQCMKPVHRDPLDGFIEVNNITALQITQDTCNQWAVPS